MGSECNNPSKRHYDITMSKRTRKPLLNLHEAAAANNRTKNSNINPTTTTTKVRSIFESWGRKADDESDEGEEDSSDQHRKSLKQLINYGARNDGNEQEEERSDKNYCSLGHHFTQEKEVDVQARLQIVKKHQHPRQDGVRGMMSRYAKVLSHLVKAKREPRITASRKAKTHFFRLSM